MNKELHPQNILAIESAVGDGSLALLQRGITLVIRSGDGASRAERIVPLIHESLEVAGLTLQDLDSIAVSAGPGSYSGIRIGMSIALGLGDALAIPCVGIPVLHAMASASEDRGPIVCAVPIGKLDVAWQSFGPKSDTGRRAIMSMAKVCRASELFSDINPEGESTIHAHSELLGRLGDHTPEQIRIVDVGTGLAEMIGRFAPEAEHNEDSMSPIYIRNRELGVRSF